MTDRAKELVDKFTIPIMCGTRDMDEEDAKTTALISVDREYSAKLQVLIGLSTKLTQAEISGIAKGFIKELEEVKNEIKEL